MTPFLVAAAALAAAQAPDREVIAGIVGGYRVIDQASQRPLCTLRLRWEPTVGGEVTDADGCARAAPDLAESLRWYLDPDTGETVFEDALHGVRARIVEDDAGSSARLMNGRLVRLEPLRQVKLIPPDRRVLGRWLLVDRYDAPVRPRCTVDVLPGHVLQIARSCPGTLLPYAAGRWRASNDALVLTSGRSSRRYEFGGDPTIAFALDRRTMLSLRASEQPARR